MTSVVPDGVIIIAVCLFVSNLLQPATKNTFHSKAAEIMSAIMEQQHLPHRPSCSAASSSRPASWFSRTDSFLGSYATVLWPFRTSTATHPHTHRSTLRAFNPAAAHPPPPHTPMTDGVQCVQEVESHTCRDSHKGGLNDSQLAPRVTMALLSRDPQPAARRAPRRRNADGGLSVTFATEIGLSASLWRHY